MVADIKARTELRDLRANLGEQPSSFVVGRRSSERINIHYTQKISTTNRSSDSIWGRDFWDNVTATALAASEVAASWDESYDDTAVTSRIVSKDNEFHFSSDVIINEFFNSSVSTATINTTTEVITF